MFIFHRVFVLLFLAIATGGCASVQLPLCPALARASYEIGGPPSDINRILKERSDDHVIKIAQTSRFTAEFSSSLFAISWLKTNYPFLVCSFDPSQVDSVKVSYDICMRHVEEWIRIIGSDHPDELMLDPHGYQEACVRQHMAARSQ